MAICPLFLFFVNKQHCGVRVNTGIPLNPLSQFPSTKSCATSALTLPCSVNLLILISPLFSTPLTPAARVRPELFRELHYRAKIHKHSHSTQTKPNSQGLVSIQTEISFFTHLTVHWVKGKLRIKNENSVQSKDG